MNSSDINLDKQRIRSLITDAGAVAVGFAKAERIPDRPAADFSRWLDEGRAGELAYMHKYPDIRRDPKLLLPDAHTVISIAFSYNPPRLRDDNLPRIARYAYGQDYHDALRARLRPVADAITELSGAACRICIDSAPIPERFWALRAGIGRRALNSSVIVDGFGSFIFLAEIITTLELEPDSPSSQSCLQCGRCIEACPTGALVRDTDNPGCATVDASRCLSALTIEHKGEWSTRQVATLDLQMAPITIFGCDRCQDVCPHNLHIPATEIAEFHASETILSISDAELADISDSDFRTLFRHTPLLRSKAEGIRRNASLSIQKSQD